MTLLTREAILKVDDRKTEDVDVPEWGGVVRLRSLTGAERDRIEASMVEIKGKSQRLNLVNLRAKMVAAAAVDAAGHPLFRESDVKALGEKNAAVISRLAEKAQELSGMAEEDVEELTANFNDDPSDASTSG